MKKLNIGELVSNAWDLAVQHWPIFVLISVISSLVGGIGVKFDPTGYIEALNIKDAATQIAMIQEAISVNYLTLLIGFLLSLYISYVSLNLYVNATTQGKPYSTLTEALKVDFNQLAIFFCAEVCYGLIVGLGLCCCLLPGIWLGVRLWYVPLLAATQGASFGEAFRRSWEMTRGHFWELFLMGITIFGIAILGVCACFVGIYFAEVITQFMVVLSFFALMPSEFDASTEDSDYVEVQ